MVPNPITTQFFDEDGKWLVPPQLTVKTPLTQKLERDQREALAREDQLLDAIKKEFQKED